MSKIVNMQFSADQFYVTAKNKESDMKTPLYEKGKIYGIEEKMVPRWLKRGGVIVEVPPTPTPVKGPIMADKKQDEKPDKKVEDQKDGENESKSKEKSGKGSK